MSHHQVKFLPENRVVEISEETSLLEAVRQSGIQLKASCGGKGTCGSCKVKIIAGKTQSAKTGKLTKEELDDGIRLACNTFALSDLTVEIPTSSRLQEHQVLTGDVRGLLKESQINLLEQYGLSPLTRKINLKLSAPTLTDNASDWSRINMELRRSLQCDEEQITIPLEQLRKLPSILRNANWQVSVILTRQGDKYRILDIQPLTDAPIYGLAVDIGTTTVVVYLVNLQTGEIIDKQGTYNKQAQYGDDVISRIVYANESDAHLEEMRLAVTSTLNELITAIVKRQRIRPETIMSAVIAANTTMTQLFLGVNPKYIRLEPYIPTFNRAPEVTAKELGIRIYPEATIYCFPSIASYVGGDIVAGTLVSGMARKDEIVLFIDIGTNGEIVLGNQDWLVSCACSAGPCFEGGGITFGMRAMPGAIERIAIDPHTLEVELQVIGKAKPLGICGSGLVDVLSKLRNCSVIDRAGNFQMNHPSKSPRLRSTDVDREFVLAWAEEAGGEKDVVITENDIKNLIRAKGAIFAGIRSLLAMVAMDIEMIDRVIIAGGFGNYLNIADSVAIGLLPDIDPQKYEFIGNSSVKGAYLALISEKAWNEAQQLAKKITYIELSVGTTFMDEFVSALFLPHTDLSLFPSISN